MPTAGGTHHVVLDGVGYMLRQTADGLAYRRGETPYLVPRRAADVGRSALTRPGSDNGGFAAGVRPLFGQGGYTRAAGIDARAGDGLRIAARPEAVSGLAKRVTAWADFNGTVYAGAESGSALKVYKYNAGTNTFAEMAGAATDAARLVPMANTLWAVQSGGGAIVIDTADTATAASGTNAAGLVELGRAGTRLVGLTGPGATRAVRWATLGGDAPPTLNFTTANEDGDPREPVAGLAALGEDVYLAKRDGLYRVTFGGGPSVSLSRVVDHSARRDADNFRALAVFQGALYYTIRDRLLRWTGSREEDVSPPPSLAGPAGEGVTRTVVKALASGSGWLWALAESDETARALTVWAYNGGRWEQVTQVVTGPSVAAGTLHVSPTVGRLLVNYSDGFGWNTVKIDLRATSDLPAAVFDPTGNVAYLAPVDGGLPDVTKRFHSVAVRGSGIGAATAVYVWYFNGLGWTSLGSLTSGSGGELLFPGVVTGKSVLVRLDLRSDGVATPVVREVGVTYDVLPGPAQTVEFEALLAPHLRLLDGGQETLTPTQLLAHLDAARAAGTVVTLADPVTSAAGGAPLAVRVTEVTVKTLLTTPDAGGQYGWLAHVRCEVV